LADEEIIKIEEMIDKAIEEENFQLLNELLEKRENLLKKGISEELAKLILEKDKQRKNKILEMMEQLGVQAKNIKLGEKALKGYGGIEGLNNTGGRFKGRG
jgi:hypothetical protein